MNFANHVDIAAREVPGTLAMSDPRREMNYADLAAETAAVADGLADLGVDPGDRVALFVPNSVTFATAHLGAMKRGAIPVPVNLRFGGSEIGHVLEDVDPTVAVSAGPLADVVAEAPAEVDHHIVANGERGIDYGEFVADAEKSVETHPRRDGELAQILYTSGTTGRPKGVKHTHRNLDANARGGVWYAHYRRDDVGLTVCPTFHASGLNVTTLPLLSVGAENHFLPEWDPGRALETMAARSVTVTMVVPTMLLDLLETGTEGYDLSALERVLVGGAPVPAKRLDDAESALGADILEGYGLTETAPLAAQNTPESDADKPAGSAPVAREVIDVRVEDPATREEVPTGEPGELLVRGDTVTPGYWNLPEKDAEAFVERPAPAAADADGTREWLRTGDIGRIDADDYVIVEDRLDDMIVTGGENVYPSQIEAAIADLDGVQDAAVIGTAHDRLGQQVTAVVRAGGGVTAADVEAACRDRLADYKVPREVHFVEEMPKTATRKIDKEALREEYDT